jgi:secondary thiamine-phosphate synthase enzyme
LVTIEAHMLHELTIRTTAQSALINITDRVSQLVRESGVSSGVCYVYVPHTTAGITINENADPHVVEDILMELDKRVPMSDGYRHVEGNSAAHIKASLMGFCQVMLIENRRLALGTWQGLYLAEFDGPRQRRVLVKILADPQG